MAKRIVKVTLSSGKTKYIVQHNEGLFGLRRKFDWWKTCKRYDKTEPCDAVFDYLESANLFCVECNESIEKSEIIRYYN